MANALLGVPQDYTVAASGGSNIAFVTNDEPGLVFSANLSAAGQGGTITGALNIDFDVTDSDPIGALVVLGLFTPFATGKLQFTWKCATTSANRTAGTFTYASAALTPEFSTNRTAAEAKHLFMLPATRTERYWRLVVQGLSTPVNFQPWRILLCKVIQPADNIEVGAGSGVDDRSDRRYARSGRRVIDPTVICPTFQGTWPWIDDTTMKQDIRPLMFKRAGTFPVLFVLDPADTTWGEDAVFYGDLEKNQSISFDDGQLYSYSISIVSIAP